MNRTLTFNGRLPGVVCETALPPQQENPLRLDVTGFVGFAERGPCDIPVALHDIEQYRAVFGGDLALARMSQGNQIVYANLQRAVQSFFDNGGQRCYVVRVAGAHALPNYFRIPGILAWDSNAQTLCRVVAPAAWPGRWSARMGVGTQLLSQTLALAQPPIVWNKDGSFSLHLILPTTTSVQRNDVLRLHFSGQGKPLIYCYVSEVKQEGLSPTIAHGFQVLVAPQANARQSFTNNVLPIPLPGSIGRMQGSDCQSLEVSAPSLYEVSDLDNGYVLSMRCATQVEQADVLCIDGLDGESILFPVDQIAQQSSTTSPGQTEYTLTSYEPTMRLTPTLVERLDQGGWQPMRVLLSAHQLEMRMTRIDREYILHLEAADAGSILVGDVLRVTCVNGGQLLFPVSDMVTPQGDGGPSSSSSASSASSAFASSSSSQISSPPETTSAQIVSQEALWFYSAPSTTPMGYGSSIASSVSSASSPPLEEAYGELKQVDLLSFNLYVREEQTILETWNDLRFGAVPPASSVIQKGAQSQSSSPAVQSWLDVLVPSPDNLRVDIAHPGVTQRDIPGLDPTRSARLGKPCPLPSAAEGSAVTPLYLPLGMDDLPLPDEFSGPLIDQSALAKAIAVATNEAQSCPGDDSAYYYGTDDLDSYNDPPALFLDNRLADVGYRDLLIEANAILLSSPDVEVDVFKGLHSLLFIDEIGIVALPDLAQRAWRRPKEPPQGQSTPQQPAQQPVRDWSLFKACYPPLDGQPGQPEGRECVPVLDLPIIETPDDYSPLELEKLIQVQTSLVNFCAARADVLGVLSLPLHFKRRDVLNWQQRFTGRDDFLDGVPLSYVAAYHPWLQTYEDLPLQGVVSRSVPPDGVVCGMIAARELARGPWIAPANVPLRGVIGLSPVLTDRDWIDLFNAQVNLVRQLPGQFTLMSAHTLSLEDTFLQISVRRLLIFLRKLALLRGMRYVFEVNNERFRERVQADFEAILHILAERGAISAFEVVTDSSINTQNDYDNGRFLIAIRVAPTLPIEFITIVLLRVGVDLLSVIEG